MNTENWKIDQEDELYYNNHGNGGFEEWVNLSDLDLTQLLLKYFSVSIATECKVRVKAKEGKLIIEELKTDDD